MTAQAVNTICLQVRSGGRGVGARNEIVLLNFNANLIYFSYHFLVDPANFLLSLLLMQTLKCSSMISTKEFLDRLYYGIP